MKKKINDIKFQFGTDLQYGILKFTLTDANGHSIINLYEDYYFDLVEYQVIAAAIKGYFKRKKRIASQPLLLEELRKMMTKKPFAELISKDDRDSVVGIVKKLYKGFVKEPDAIKEEAIQFARFVSLREETETLDIYDYQNYPEFVKKVQKAITIGSAEKEESGTFLVRDIKRRQIQRKMRDSTFPLPFWQLNKATNANGYNPGAIFTILDKPKGFKTGILANIARKYMSFRKPIIIFDLENGEENISLRLEQQLLKAPKNEVLSHKHDVRIQKILRKYARLGCEVVIKRLPAHSTTQDFQKWIDFYYKEHGLKFSYAIIDYIGLMASHRVKTNSDDDRISNAYLEVKDWAEENKFIHVWTGHHVKREAYNRRATKYQAEDTALCIQIHRHVEGLFAIQQSETERTNNVARIEVIDQRDGVGDAKCLMWLNIPHQRADEFTHAQVEDYNEQLKKFREENPVDNSNKKKKVKSNDI